MHRTFLTRCAQIACMMSCTLGTMVVVTGHSLGRNKLENILKGTSNAASVVCRTSRGLTGVRSLTGGKMTRSETETQYRIGRRIEARRRLVLAPCDITSSYKL